MFYLCDINMISYLTILTGQVLQKCWAVNMISFTYKIQGGGGEGGDGVSETTLGICNIRK